MVEISAESGDMTVSFYDQDQHELHRMRLPAV
jgi:hypothetical protein